MIISGSKSRCFKTHSSLGCLRVRDAKHRFQLGLTLRCVIANQLEEFV